jgi:hypothetical protein
MFTKTAKAKGQRGPVEIYTVGEGMAVSGSTFQVAAPQLPLNGGYLWSKIRLIWHYAVTVGSNDYPYELGGYYFATNVNLVGDGRIICNCPGGALYWLNTLRTGGAPHHVNLLAGSATYDYVMDIPFVYPRWLKRREDGMIDDTAYSNMILTVSCGGLAQLFNTVSGGALSTTVDVIVEREKIANFQNAKPAFEPEIRSYAQLTTSTPGPYFDLETNPNLFSIMFFLLSGGSATAPFMQQGGSNGAWGGSDAWDAVILDDADRGFMLNQVPVGQFQGDRVEMIPYLYAFGGGTHVNSPTLVGLQPHVFTKSGHLGSGYPCFGKDGSKLSRLKLKGTLTAGKYTDLLMLNGRKIGYGANGVRYYY